MKDVTASIEHDSVVFTVNGESFRISAGEWLRLIDGESVRNRLHLAAPAVKFAELDRDESVAELLRLQRAGADIHAIAKHFKKEPLLIREWLEVRAAEIEARAEKPTVQKMLARMERQPDGR